MLLATGALTIDAVNTAKATGKPIVFAKPINEVSGRVSHETDFSADNWGKKTLEYIASINEDLKPESLEEITKDAYSYYKKSKKFMHSSTAGPSIVDDEPQPARRRRIDIPKKTKGGYYHCRQCFQTDPFLFQL